MGCTPSWWQLLKAFHETGNEVIATPYLGDPIESLWWRTYPNPCSLESRLYNSYLERKKRKGRLAGRDDKKALWLGKATNGFIRDRWKRHIIKILEREKDIDAIFFMNVPINHITGIAEMVRSEYSIPVAYFDGDMPTILPKYALERGFKTNYYQDADLSEFDVFFTNSKGVIPDLRELGAHDVFPLYYAVDPEFFRPKAMQKTSDVSFYGHGDELRKEWMHNMITVPSRKLPNVRFSVGGDGFTIDLGNARRVGVLPYSSFRDFCCSSTISLNITRWSHANVYGSSTARPFELAGFESCIVSQPCSGMEEWFDRKEVVIVNSAEEAMEIYQCLLDQPDDAVALGQNARRRVLTEHNFHNRARHVTSKLAAA